LLPRQRIGREIRADIRSITTRGGPAEPVSHTSFPAIIEETLLARITAGLGYASWLLDHVDPTQRLTHVAFAAQLEAGDFMAWRTQREQDASPNGGTVSMFGNNVRKPVALQKPRAALRLDRQRLAEDLLVPLRRQWKQR
jgi:hypothetical protein